MEIELPPEDQSVIKNGQQLLAQLSSLAPPGWIVIHGHRHLPSVQYTLTEGLVLRSCFLPVHSQRICICVSRGGQQISFI